MKYLPIILILLAAFLVWRVGVHELLSFESFKTHHVYLKDFISDNKLVSILLFMAIYIGIVSLSIPVATFLTLTGGYFFGHLLGTVMVVIAASIGASVIFSGTRMATRNNTKKEKPSKLLEKMRKGFKQEAFLYMLTLRLIPIFPFVLVNIGAGILQVKPKIFFFGTLLGIIPGTFVYVSIGTALQSLLNSDVLDIKSLINTDVIIALTGLGILSLLPILYHKIKIKRGTQNLKS